MTQPRFSIRRTNFLALMGALLGAIAQPVTANENSYQKFDQYTVHFSVFNSTFLTPEVARVYNLTRANDRALINISVVKSNDGQIGLGLPAKVSGTATNLMQQQRVLKFQTVDEGDATYYLAELRHTNEEVMNFTIEVQPDTVNETGKTYVVNFTRKLYVEK